MTLEELQAELDKANGKIDALVNKNSEILDEKKKLEKKYKEVDADEYFKLRDDYDSLASDYKKIEQSNSKLLKDNESLIKTVGEKDGNLEKLLIDGGISKALNSLDKHKLNDGALELATLDIKSKGVALVDGVAMVGDKPLNDFISTDWLEAPSSKNLVTQNENSGGGASGGKGGANNIDTSNLSPTEKMKHGRG